MARSVRDEEYMEWLPNDFFRRKYLRWKERTLNALDTLIYVLRTEGAEAAVSKFQLSEKDQALLVRLEYLTPNEVEEFGIDHWRNGAVE